MSMPALIIKATVVAATACIALSAAVVMISSKPRLAARVLGAGEAPSRHPSDVGLAAVDVEYRAWLSRLVDSGAECHGLRRDRPRFRDIPRPRATDPAPRLELAALLANEQFASLVISLGYASGAHPHSGGHLEAEDIGAAVRWARAESRLPVALIGFSAGGHAAVAASARCDPCAIVTDSAFVDFTEVVKAQSASIVGAPAWVLGPVNWLMGVVNGCAPVNLESHRIAAGVPMLHLHGTADTAIAFDNLQRLAAITGGEAIAFPGADHVEALRTDPDLYRNTVIPFLKAAAHAAR